jgi:L-alanine-DL-glutamate epimerase-like enolase superfamily enzyme
MRPTDVVHFHLALQTETFRYRTPMKFGGRVVNDVTVLSAHCDCKLRSGESTSANAAGLGAMTMGVAWAWPHPTLDDAKKLTVVLELANRVVEFLHREKPQGHPLEMLECLDEGRSHAAARLQAEFSLDEPIPPLAVLLATSPIEASLFDAQGKAAGLSSYAMLGKEFVSHDLSRYLGPGYEGMYLDEFISDHPAETMPLYHLVGALDPLDESDVGSAVGDGLPESLAQWIVRDGLTHLKIKLAGDNFDWDLNRVARVHDVAVRCGVRDQAWYYSLDFNERCDSAGYVLSLIDAIESQSPEAFASIQYIEQPTHRDLEKHPENVMHEVAKRLPVVIDESLVDLKSLRLAVQQGYSGVALKACKGHGEAMLMAAVARHEKLYLCVQDLTCVGVSLLHSASLAAHIPGVAAIESNGRQYCPEGNAKLNDAFPGMFNVRGGQVPTRCLNGVGLGYGNG